VLTARPYGVWPITTLALTCLRSRAAGSPPAERRRGSPGWMSPCIPPTANDHRDTCPGKGPDVPRWGLYEAAWLGSRLSPRA
jgi:hypothetical protein